VVAGFAAIVSLLSACAPTPSGAVDATSASGLLVVTTGGTALVDGQADVPPTLDLRITGSVRLTPAQVYAVLDGARLPLAAEGDALTASVAPMQLGSDHALDLTVPNRRPQHFAFHVAQPAGAAAAFHTHADAAVLDVAFEFAPVDRHAVEAALPGNPAAITWVDDTHLRATWAGAPGGSFALPATLATARGSHLATPLTIALTGEPPGVLRRTVVPEAPARLSGKPLVVAFTVGTVASRGSLAAHADRISVVSPIGLQIGSDGSLSGEPDAPAVATANAHGLPVWPLIQNDASDAAGTAALLGSDAAVNRLVTAMTSLDFPGVQLDVEGVPPDSRDRLTAMIQRLADAQHAKGHKLAVAVVPHKPDHLNVYSAAYDLQAIAAKADLVTLMAYDEHTALSDPGPVAGLQWDQQVLAGSLADIRDSSVALLGMPLYSRAWESGDVTADSYSASVTRALAASSARVDYDFAAATPAIHYGDSAILWFDDAQSLAAKAALVQAEKLRGVALWRLGFEDPATWNLLPATPPRP